MIGDERPKALAEVISVAKVGARIGFAKPMCRTETAPQEIAALDEQHGLEFQKCLRMVQWYSNLFPSCGLAVTDARYFAESRRWWMEYREVAKISEGEKDLIFQGEDRWVALGIVAG